MADVGPLLAEIEALHGFRFGTPDDVEVESAGAPASLTLVCRTSGCERMNRQTILHADTVLPVVCGGCGAVLHCLHDDTEKRTIYGGTLAAPTRGEVETCRACRTPVGVSEPRPINPADIPLGELLAR